MTDERFRQKYDTLGKLQKYMLEMQEEIPSEGKLADDWQDIFDRIVETARDGQKSHSATFDYKMGNPVPEELFQYIFKSFFFTVASTRKGSIHYMMPREEIIKAYRKERSIKKAAKALGISHPIVIKVLHEANITMRKHGRPFKTSDYLLEDFIKKNPNVKLPKNIAKMAKLTNISKPTLYTYFRIRKNRILSKIATFPDLRRIDLILIYKGKNIRTMDFMSYKYDVNRYDLKVTIKADVIGLGEIEFPRTDYKTLRDAIDEAEKRKKDVFKLW